MQRSGEIWKRNVVSWITQCQSQAVTKTFLFQNIFNINCHLKGAPHFQKCHYPCIIILLLFSIFAHTTFLHFAFPLIISFLILSGFHTHLPPYPIYSRTFFTVHVSVPSAHVSAPYIIAGLTTILYYSSGYSLRNLYHVSWFFINSITVRDWN